MNDSQPTTKDEPANGGAPDGSRASRFPWRQALKERALWVGGLLGVAITAIVQWGAPLAFTEISAMVTDAGRADNFPIEVAVDLQPAFDSVVLLDDSPIAEKELAAIASLEPDAQATWFEENGVGVVVGPRTITLTLEGDRTKPVTLTGIRTIDECAPHPTGTYVRMRDASYIREGSAEIRAVVGQSSGESFVQSLEGDQYFQSPDSFVELANDGAKEILVIDIRAAQQNTLCTVQFELTAIDSGNRTYTKKFPAAPLTIAADTSNARSFGTVYLGGELCQNVVLASDGCSTVEYEQPFISSDPAVVARSELQPSDDWVAIPSGGAISAGERRHLATLSTPEQIDWLVENAGGAVYGQRTVRLFLQGNRTESVRVTDLRVVGECGDGPTGALIMTHGGKGGEQPVRNLTAEFDPDTSESTISGENGVPYFDDNTITLADGEEFVLDVDVSLAFDWQDRTNILCSLGFELSVLDNGADTTVPIPAEQGVTLFRNDDPDSFDTIYAAGDYCRGQFALEADVLAQVVRCPLD